MIAVGATEANLTTCASSRGCHKDAHPFFFLLWHPLSDVWYLPTNRHQLHTNHHRLPTNRHRLPTGHIVGRIGHSEFFCFFFITAPPGLLTPAPPG